MGHQVEENRDGEEKLVSTVEAKSKHILDLGPLANMSQMRSMVQSLRALRGPDQLILLVFL